MRVGMGYDVHRLTEGRDLILGGVKIPYEFMNYSSVDVTPGSGACESCPGCQRLSADRE